MKKIFFIAVCSLMLFSLTARKTNDAAALTIQMSDSIRITACDFKVKAGAYLDRIKKRDNSFSNDDLITIVRIYNSLMFDLSLRRQYSEFYKKCPSVLMSDCVTRLEMSVWRDGSYYSQKYKLYIGGKEDDNSRYYIVGK